MPHRCAFGCKNTDMVMHVFLKPDKFLDHFKVWVNLLEGKSEKKLDLVFYKKKRVCDIHFPDEVKVSCKRLSVLAVPVLHLPVAKQMTKPAQLFVRTQLQTKKKLKGRRFSIEEKVLCVSLFKKSCYRLLSKYFTLPSSKAMKRLLGQLKLLPGIINNN